MKISARNQLPGAVKSVTQGAVMAEVVVTVDGGHEIVAAITAESARRLDLATGQAGRGGDQVDRGHARRR